MRIAEKRLLVDAILESLTSAYRPDSGLYQLVAEGLMKLNGHQLQGLQAMVETTCPRDP